MKKLSLLLSTLLIATISAEAQTAPPAITALSVAAAIPGTTVTISGSGFNATAANNIVYFGATRASVSSASSTALTVTVPLGASYSQVSVNNTGTGLTGFSRGSFVPMFNNSGGYTPAINLGSYKDLRTDGYPYPIVNVTDMDGDGKPDIVAQIVGGSDGGGSRIGIFRNNTVTGEVFDPTTETPIIVAAINYGVSGIAIGDVDGDGKPDVVVSGFDSLSVIRNNSSAGTISSATFASPVTFHHSALGGALALSDIDVDGKQDILVTGESYISLFRNLSTAGAITTASLDSEVTIIPPAGFGPMQLVTGDIDGDGKPDLLIPSGYSGSGDLYIFRNTSSSGGFSSSTFGSPVIFPAVARVALADLNTDGKQDIVYANGGGLAIMMNSASPGSISSSSFGGPVYPATDGVGGITDVKIADMDGDAKPDIVLKGFTEPSTFIYYSTVSILKNNVTGGTVTTSSFASSVNFFGDPVGNATYGAGGGTNLTIDDLNGDTKPDIVVKGDFSLTVIHTQTPPPTITSLSATTGNPGTSVTIAGSNFNPSPSGNSVFFGATKANVVSSSAGSLSVTVPVGATFEPVSVTNIAISGTAYSASAFLPRYDNSAYVAGTIGFDPAVNWELNGNGFKIAAGDLDGDGKSDLVMRNGTDSVYVYRNISTSGSITSSSFAAPVAFSAGLGFYYFSTDVKLGDMDNDGKLDIVCGHGDGFSILRNTSTTGVINSSSFARTDFTVDQYTHWSWYFYGQFEMNIVDIDGDGKLDVAMSSASPSESSIAFFHNQGFPGSVTRASFDEPSLLYYYGSGSGAPLVQSILFSDLNVDGKPELIIGHSNFYSGGEGNSTLKIYKNISTRGTITVTSGYAGYTSAGSFADPISYDFSGSGTLKSLAVADIDGDGKPDLLARNYVGDTLKIFRNTTAAGAISFAPEVNFSAPPVTNGLFSDMALGDFDGDGKADIVVSNCSLEDSTISVYRNIASAGSITSGSLAARRNFKTIRFPSALTVADMDGDGKSDIIVKRPYIDELTPHSAFSILRNDPAVISGATAVCSGSTTTLSSGLPGGTWSSSNTAVATVGSTGIVTSVSAGTTTISYSYSGGVSTSVITVDTPASAGTITGSTFICGTGTSALSTVATGGVWSSSNTTVATVGSVSGIVSGGTVGTAIISYAVTNSCGTAVATTMVTVNPMPNGVINGASMVCLGGTLSLTGFYMTGGAWSSAAPSTASVDAVTGVVTGVATGTTTISYTVTNVCGSHTGTKLVTVQLPASAGTISGLSTVCVGAQITLSRTVSGGTWLSGNTSVATVNSSGRVTGVAAGTVSISYRVTNSCGDVYATMPVTVNPIPAAISGPSYIMIGTPASFSNTVAGGQWASSAPAIASIDSGSGIVTGLSAGSLVISYTLPAGCFVTANRGVFNTSSIITTIAGNGVPGYSGDGMAATATALHEPHQITGDAAGNIYFVDKYNDRVRKISPSGIIFTVVGGGGDGGYSGDGGQATAATLFRPEGMTFDAAGNMYVADQLNQRIRKITPAGIISTVAGNGIAGISGDGGAATAAMLFNPTSVCVDASGNLLIADLLNKRVRKVDPAGIITTVAGNGVEGLSGDGGPATAASLGAVTGVSTDYAGNMYILSGGTTLRKVNTSGIISRVAGTGATGSTGDGGPATAATFNSAYGLYIDSVGNIYIAEVLGQRIRKIDTSGIISTIAGTGISGFSGDGGPAVLAKLHEPMGVFVSATGQIYISDGDNDRIRAMNLAPAITGSANVCVAATVTLNISSSGGTWSSSNTSIATIGSSTGVVTGIATGTVTISYIYSGGTATKIVTVITTPTSGTITGTATICAGNTTTLGSTATGGTWTSSATGIATINSSGIVTGVAAGTATISYAVTNGCGTSTVGVIVTVNPAPDAGAITGTASVCVANTVTLTNAVTGGAWTSATPGVATVSGGVVTGVAAGAAIISYAVTNSCGTATVTKIVTVNAIPDAGTITGTATLCLDSTTTLSNAVTGGTWISGATGIATITSGGVVTGVTAGTATISYAVTNGCGSSATTRIVTVNAAPAAGAITGTATVCAGTTTTFSNAVTGGTWTSAATGIATVTSGGVVTGVTAGTSAISYVVTNGCGTATATKIITVNAAPAAITGPTTVTLGSAITLSSATAGGIWASSNSSIAAVGSGSGVVSGVAIGTATISYTASGCYAIRSVTVNTSTASPMISTVAGYGTIAYDGDGILATASGVSTRQIAMDTAGNLYIADWYHNRIRKVSTSGIISTVAGSGTAGYSGDGMAATVAQLNTPEGIAVDNAGNLYIGDVNNNRVRKVSASGIITTVAGNGLAGGSGDGGNATNARLNEPRFLYVDATGNIFIADVGNSKIRMVNTSGIITTFAGSIPGFAGDGGPATAARLNNPRAIWKDASGNAYISDASNYRIRKVNTSGVISTIAGNGLSGYSGDGGPATAAAMRNPFGLFVDDSNNIYFADKYNFRIRKIDASGIISSIAGTGVPGFSGDGGPATAARVGYPYGCYGDNSGNIYVSDENNYRVRKIGSPLTPITGLADVCIASSITLNNSSAGGTWSSSNTAVATIGSSSGVLTGVTPGTCAINYTYSAGIVTVIATVNSTVTIGDFNGTTSICADGVSSLYLSDGSDGFWSSGNTSVATVTSSTGGTIGIVNGIAAGTAVISFTKTNGCGSATSTVMMTVSAAPSAGTITGTASVCISATTTLGSAVTGGTWTSGATGIATVNSSGVVTGVTAGTATISYVVNNGCGTAAATKIVTVNVAPSAGTITGSSTLAVSGTITLSSAVSGGTWSSGATGIATVNSSGVVTGVAAGTVIISYSVTNGCGTAVATKTVTVNPATSIDIFGDPTVCAGSTTSLTPSVSGGTWTSSNTAKATVSAAGVVTGVAAGTSIITYNVSGSIATVIVTVNAALPAITGTAKACPGTTTTLSNTVAGGTWSSSNTAVATAGAATGVITGVVAGTTNVVYTALTGCTKSSTVTINATPTIGGTLSACVGTTAGVTSSPAASSWSSSTPSVATISATGVVTALATGTTTISVTATTGCTASAVFTVGTITPIDGMLTTCVGSTTSLSNATGGGTWSSSNAGVASVNSSGVVSGANAGTTTISYAIAGGCRSTAIVTVSALPTIAGSPVMCAGNSVALAGSPAGGTWSSTGLATATVSSTGVVTGVATGTTGIVYTATTGCSRTIVATVTNTPGSFTGTTSICQSTTTTLTNSVAGGTWSSSNASLASVGVSNGVVTGAGAGTVLITYKIGSCLATTPLTVLALPNAITGTAKACVGLTTTLSTTTTGGTWSSANPSIHTVDAAGVVTGVAAGTTNIVYTGSNTCTRSVVVTINALPNSLTGSRGMCVGATTTLASSTSGVLSWSSSDVTKATVNTAGVVTGVALGTSNITYTLTTGCYTTAQVTVSAGPSAITGTLSACSGTTTALGNATTGGTWSSANTGVAQVDTNGVVTGMVAGTTTITYSLGGGCRVTAPITVLAGASPITGTPDVCTGTTMYPYLAVVGGGTWSSTDITVATVPSTHGAVFGVSAGTSTIVFTSTNGCTSTKVVTVSNCPSRGMSSTGVHGVSATTISLYPNPTKGTFTISTPEAGTLVVSAIDGREVMRAEAKSGTTEISLSRNMATGVYMCRFIGDHGATMTVRLMYEQE